MTKTNEGMSNDEVQFWFQKNTNTTWKCEPNLKGLCTAFDEHFPECTPAPGNRSSWYAGLRVIVREFGPTKGVEFIRFAKQQSQRAPHLTIDDAHSIKYLIPRFKKGDVSSCPNCSEHWSTCICEWGSKMRNQKYGGES